MLGWGTKSVQVFKETSIASVLIWCLGWLLDCHVRATTSMKSGASPLGGECSYARRLWWIQWGLSMDAPGGVNCPARRCLQLLVVLRCLVPGGTCPPPSDWGTLELSSGWRVLPVWVRWLWPIRMGPDRLASLVNSWRVG